MKNSFQWFVLLGLALTTNAFAIDYFRDVPENECPNRKEINGGYTLVCQGNAQAYEVLRARIDRKTPLQKLPVEVEYLDIVELGVWPDDSTNMIYYYAHRLTTSKGELIGYTVISGYENSEMGIKTQMTTRYNLQGKLTSITLK